MTVTIRYVARVEIFNQACYFSYTVIKAFGGLVIFRAIASQHYQIKKGNICTAQIPAIAWFFPSYSWILSQLCFPCNFWYFSQVEPGYCHRFNLGIELSQLFMVYERKLLIKTIVYQCFYCVVVKVPALKQLGLVFHSRWVQFYFVSPQHHTV